VIDRLGAQGDGIAQWQGESVFVPCTVPGDRVWVRLGASRAGGREGRLVELVSAGAGRRAPT
jgi:23S rRNA (uracil1939-C5)-methyltransferase